MTRYFSSAAAAGAIAMALIGIGASVDSAHALPIAISLDRAAPHDGVTAVQYAPYGYRYARPYRYGYRPYYRGYAGVYRCGPYALKTRLQRKACR